MKILILFLFISSTCIAQRSYFFDHMLEYQYEFYTDSSKNKNVYYFTNSKDNSYFARLEEKDSLNFNVLLVEHDRLRMEVLLKKQDIFQAENLVIQCTYNWNGENHFKFRTREYAFISAADTLIDNTSLQHYSLQYIAPRKRRTRHVGSNHYIIQDSTDFHLPLLTHPTAFEEWKEEKNIPNGIFREKIFYDHKNLINYRYILKGYHRMEKSISVGEDCMRK